MATCNSTKVCTHCGEEKPLFDFSPNSECRGGFATRCKSCNRAYANQRTRERNRDRVMYLDSIPEGMQIRPIPNHPGYWASKGGRIWSQNKGSKLLPWLREVRPYVGNNGQICVDLYDHYKRRRCQVAVFVLEAFVGPALAGQEARHLNDIKTDNRLENLAWGTHEQNMQDAVDNERIRHGETSPVAKLLWEAIAEIRQLARPVKGKRHPDSGIKAAAAKYGVSTGAIYHVLKSSTWRRSEQ